LRTLARITPDKGTGRAVVNRRRVSPALRVWPMTFDMIAGRRPPDAVPPLTPPRLSSPHPGQLGLRLEASGDQVNVLVIVSHHHPSKRLRDVRVRSSHHRAHLGLYRALTLLGKSPPLSQKPLTLESRPIKESKETRVATLRMNLRRFHINREIFESAIRQHGVPHGSAAPQSSYHRPAGWASEVRYDISRRSTPTHDHTVGDTDSGPISARYSTAFRV